MKAFEIRTSESDYPFLVIANGYKEALEIIHKNGIYDLNIISIKLLDFYKDNHILLDI